MPYSPEGDVYVRAADAVVLSNSTLAVTELDTQGYGGHDYVEFVLLIGTPSDTAAIGAFTILGGDTSADNSVTVASHAAIAAHATNNDNKTVRINIDLKAAGVRFMDCTNFTETATQTFEVEAAFWVLKRARTTPSTAVNDSVFAGSGADQYMPGSPVVAT